MNWLLSWGWRRTVVLAASVSVLAFIMWMLGFFKCEETTYEWNCTFEGIGDFPGGDYPPATPPETPPSIYSGAYGVSEDGVRVVGHGTVDKFPPGDEESRMAVGWTSSSGTIGFWNPSDPPGLIELGYGSAPGDTRHHSFAARISDDGKVVAGTVLVNSVQRPARWLAGVVVTLPSAAGDAGGEVCGLSGDGKVFVGFSCPRNLLPKDTDLTTPRHALRWVAWSGEFPFVELPDSALEVNTNAGRAGAVSSDGERIVGVVYDSTQAASSQVKYPVFWRRSPPLTPPPPGPTFKLVMLRDQNGNVVSGDATAITADGAIAVGCLGEYPNLHACYWELSPFSPINATLIPELPGDCSTKAFCANNVGALRVYGTRTSLGATPDCDYEGDNVGSFVWDINQGGQDLADYMNAHGAIPSGWKIEQVNAVSKDGFTIVGTGYNSLGESEGWVYKCIPKEVKTTHWCWLHRYTPPPNNPAPPPINPLIR